MIFYFSGTGNSKWVAEQIAKALGEQTLNIVDVKNQDFTFKKGDRIGIVFPVYAWAAPEIVKKFVKKIKANGAYAFAVCTCASEAGYSIKKLSKKIKINSGYSIVMPNNYIIGSDPVDDDESAKAKVSAASKKIETICENLKNKGKIFDIEIGEKANFKSSFVSWGFNKFARATEPFSVNKHDCTKCGVCEKGCPTRTIKLEAAGPVWVEKNCYQCLSCINRCPNHAINFGKNTTDKDRYYFKDFYAQ